MRLGRAGAALVCALAVGPVEPAYAQDATDNEWTPPQDPEAGETATDLSPPNDTGDSGCFPQCRSGYVCHQGRCVSSCNPPCPQGQVCTAELECVPAGSGATGPPATGARGQWPSDSGQQGGSALSEWTPSEGSNAPRFIFGFHLGAGGELQDDESDEGIDLEPTPGMHLRFDFPIGTYFALGPAFFGGAWTVDLSGFGGGSVDRSGYFDADLYPRFRYPFAAGDMRFDVYAGLPIGYTLVIFNDDLGLADDTEHGWNIGALFGGQVFFGGSVGLMVELGWMRHAVHSAPGGEIFWNQFVLNLGLAIHF